MCCMQMLPVILIFINGKNCKEDEAHGNYVITLQSALSVVTVVGSAVLLLQAPNA